MPLLLPVTATVVMSVARGDSRFTLGVIDEGRELALSLLLLLLVESSRSRLTITGSIFNRLTYGCGNSRSLKKFDRSTSISVLKLRHRFVITRCC